jgi:hypothetical protein
MMNLFHLLIISLLHVLRGTFVQYERELLSGLAKHYLIIAFIDHRFLCAQLLGVLFRIQLQCVCDLHWLLSRVHKEDFHTDIEFTPTCLMDFEGVFLNGFHRLGEGGMQLEDHFLDEVGQVIIIVHASHIA